LGCRSGQLRGEWGSWALRGSASCFSSRSALGQTPYRACRANLHRDSKDESPRARGARALKIWKQVRRTGCSRRSRAALAASPVRHMAIRMHARSDRLDVLAHSTHTAAILSTLSVLACISSSSRVGEDLSPASGRPKAGSAAAIPSWREQH